MSAHAARLTVCLISEELPPDTGWGGIGTYTAILARGLADLGLRVHVVTRGWGGDSIQEDDGVRVCRLSVPEPSWRRGTRFFTARFGEARDILLWNLRVREAVTSLAHTERLDVIEAPEYHAQALLTSWSRPRVPIVVKLHSPAYLLHRINGVGAGWSRWDTALSERLERVLARRAALVTSPSRALAREVAAHWRLDATAIRVIANPIDEELFAPADAAGRDGATVLYAGRVEQRKGVQTLIDSIPAVLAAFPRLRVQMVGQDHPSGPGGASMHDHLQRRLAAARVPDGVVEFTGGVDRRALPALYARAGVCVVPSLYENFPYACLEAMAAGCAVVASGVGGIREIITDGADGILVPPARSDALAAGLTAVLESPSLARRLGLQARETVRARFGRAAVAAETARAYESVVAETGAVGRGGAATAVGAGVR